jgi:1-deoxy-D-xylulose-5-phosphate synthase
VIAAPRDENQLQHLLATALESGQPFALRFPRGAAPGALLDPDPKPLPIGQGELLRPGSALAFVALGPCVAAALAAAEALEARGISAAVIDARFAKPLDAALLSEAALGCGRIVTLEDHARAAGFGSAVLELLSELAPSARVLRLGIPDRFVEHGDVAAQWRAAGIDAESAAESAVRWLAGEPRHG